MRFLLIIFGSLSLTTFSQKRLEVDYEVLEYIQLKSNDDTASISKGTVSSGSLKHGKLVPYKGKNFIYFDRDSYLEGRAFLNGAALNTTLEAYDSLSRAIPNRYFNIMECSNEEGGELFPHRTHQNGLSIDFMMPLQREGKAYYALDTIGIEHYALRFDDQGRYKKDKKVQIDFDLVARQILILEHFANRNGLEIAKVIIKIELKDELFSSEYGEQLKKSGIYVVKGLSPIVNDLHDDHFHIDFRYKYPKTAPTEGSAPTSVPSEN